MSSTLRKLALATLPALALGLVAAPAQSAIQLGFLLDESGSISLGDWNVIRNGLASAVTALLPTDGSYQISVVKFDNDAEVVVNNVLINSVSARDTVTNAIRAMTREGGNTNYQAGFDLMRTTLNASANGNMSYVNLATDGNPNMPARDAKGAAVAARNALIASGVDNISIEGIDVSGNAADFLRSSICFPGPCDTTMPFNFPNQGFYIGVADASGYASAIGTKIQTVVQVPEPMSLALFGVGLAGLGLAKRRKHAI